MPADSLLVLSTRAAARLAPCITSIGDLPLRLALPILSKVASPAQLYAIEQSSPQIVGHIDDLWLAFIKRDIPNYESRPHRPSNPASWYKVYKKLKKLKVAEENASRDQLKAAMQGLKQNREANVARFVDRREDLPRGQPGVGWRQQARFDYATGKTGSKGAHKLTLFDKIRKEKAEVKAARYNRPVELGRGSMAATGLATSKAGESIVEERRRLEAEKRRERERAATTTPIPLACARRPTAAIRVTGSREEVGYNILADREARLKAMQSGHPSLEHHHTVPHSAPPALSSGRKRSANEAGLTIDDLEALYDDNDLGSDDDDDDDDDEEADENTNIPKDDLPPDIRPVKARQLAKPTPQVKTVKVRVDDAKLNAKSLPLTRTSPSSGPIKWQASPSHAVKPVCVASPSGKPMVKKRATAALFCAPKR